MNRKQGGVRSLIGGAVVAATLSASVWVPVTQAAMVTTEQAVTSQQRDARVAQVQGFLARADVKQQLETWGVAPEQAEQRVAVLSDAELDRLALNLQGEPAGGDVIWVVGVVFLVLLILELVGVTNIFTRI